MNKQDALLIDLRSRQRSAEHLDALIPRKYQSGRISNLEAIDSGIRAASPRVLLFLYDFPSVEGLNVLVSTKLTFPTLPILMLTEQHSEELAIWAFKAGARDFLFSPFNHADIEQRIALLTGFQRSGDRRRQRQRVSMPSGNALPRDARINSAPKSGKRTLPAMNYIAANIQQGLSLQQVARHCNLSTFAFSRLFREEQGISFQEYIGRCRIRRAQQLLSQPGLSVTDAALSAGFSDLSHFSRKFKQIIGSTPTNWRQQASAAKNRIRCID